MSYISTVNAFACCILDKVYDTLLKSRKGCLSDCELNSTALLTNKWRMMAEFVPAGTLVSAGFVASATLDISAFSSFGDLAGYVEIEGAVVGILPEANYANINDLSNALVNAINNGGSGYTATYVGAGVITVSAPVAGATYNGYTIEIQINPTFIVTENLYANQSGSLEIVNDTSSTFYGKTFIGGQVTGSEDRYVRVFEDMVEDGVSPISFSQSIFGSPVPFPYTLSTKRIAYNASEDRLYFTGVYGNYTYMNPGYTYFTNANYPSLTPNLYPVVPSPNNLTFQNAVYNPFDDTLRFLSGQGTGRLVKRTAAGAWSVTGGMTVDNLVQADKLAVNPINGDVWVLGSQSIYLINTAGSIATTITGTVNVMPVSITYYSASGSERMFIAFYDTVTPANSYVASYNLNGTVDNASFYSINLGSSEGAIHYSAIFNLFFINTKSGSQLYVDLVRLDGSQKQQIPITGKLTNYSYRDDVKYNKVRGSASDTTGELPTSIRTFEMTDDGSDVFDDAFFEGVDAVYTDGSNNCLTQGNIDTLIQQMNAECGCCDPSLPAASANFPSSNTYTIYYGNSSNAALDAAGVSALGSVTKSSYVGLYLFDATSPSEYKYIAFPSLLGTPSRFYDTIGGFDMVMNTVYNVTINSIVYDVYRSYNLLGGNQAVDVQS